MTAAAPITSYVLPTTPVTRGLTALAGGANSALTPILSIGLNEVDTVTTTNDSLAMPPAVPGSTVFLNNQGASTTKIFGEANIYNSNTVDVFYAHGSISSTPGATGLTLASGHCTQFNCTTMGQWKQVADWS